MNSKMKKLLFLLIIGFCLLFTLCISCYSWYNFDIENYSLKNVDDGVYQGTYSSGPVSAIVNVIVKKHRYDNIEIIEHNTGLGKEAETIIHNVIKEQSLDVDTISGATLSSKVILKSIEIAVFDK